MTKTLHRHESDADFILDVAKRLRRIPVSYGLDGFDIDCLADLSSRLRKAANAKRPKIEIWNYSITELRAGRSCETDHAILVPADDLDTAEDVTERKLAAVTAPDNGSTAEVLAAVLECARAWVPEARIMGNVRAGDIARVVTDVLEMLAASPHLTVTEHANRLFNLHGFMLLEEYRGKPAVTITFPDHAEANQFHRALCELSQHHTEEEPAYE